MEVNADTSSGGGRTRKAKPLAVLLLLSALWALDGLAPDLIPALRYTQLRTLERQAIAFALAAVVAGVYAVARRQRAMDLRSSLEWAGVVLLMLAAPVLLAAAVLSQVSQLERVAIFSLAPVFAAVLEPHLGGPQRRGNTALPAALMAVAGTLAIFPLHVPSTPVAVAAVFAMVVAALCAAAGNCVAVRLASSQLGRFAWGVAIASAAVAAVFTAIGAATESWRLPNNLAQLTWIAVVDVPALLLLFWLLHHMSATRMTARFFLAPLLTVLAGLALEQPAIKTRMVLGIALLAAGAAWLLLAQEDDEESGDMRTLHL
jgi:Permeases of the drug/metabolite transporter (DMT) superfamily